MTLHDSQNPFCRRERGHFSKLFSESRLHSFFEQVCGYSCSAVGTKPALITQRLIGGQAHRVVSWAMNQLLKTFKYRLLVLECLQPKTDVYYFYKQINNTNQLSVEMAQYCHWVRILRSFALRTMRRPTLFIRTFELYRVVT